MINDERLTINDCLMFGVWLVAPTKDPKDFKDL